MKLPRAFLDVRLLAFRHVTGNVTAALFCHGCHGSSVRMFCDVIDFCCQGRHGFSVWIARDVIALSRHGRHRFSVRIFRDVFTFNLHGCHGFSSRCEKFVADFVTHLNWVVFLYLSSRWFVHFPPGYSQSPLVLGVFYLISVSCLQRLKLTCFVSFSVIFPYQEIYSLLECGNSISGNTNIFQRKGLQPVPLVVKVPYLGENTILSFLISSSALDMCMSTLG